MKKFLFLFSIALSLLICASCKNIGVGDAIDLEAPKVAITYPANNGYVQKSFDLMGTASDNRKIEDIEVHYTYRKTHDGEKITEIKHADINGSTSVEWVCHFDFSFDQEVSITVYAIDHNRNESIDSSDSIVVVVDSQEPDPDTMLITRNSGFTTRTASIEKFLGEKGRTATRNTDSANKDNFQNESIVLSCNVKETYEIDKVYLDLYEISNYISRGNYSKTKIAGEIPVNGNITNLYNPEFTITQESLNSYSSALANGLHYIMPEVVVIDAAGNQSKPLASDVPMVFAWEDEYDKPKATLPLYYENNLLKFQEGTTVPVIIFDDDGLKSYSYKLVSRDNPDATEKNKVKTGSEIISAKNVRDHSFEIKTDKFDDDSTKIPDGNYFLYITVVDQLTSAMGGGTEHSEKEFNWKVDVKITNPDAPTINVSKPDFNATPELVAGSDSKKTKFKLEGKSIDNGEVKDIAIAWCRDEKSDAAIKYFENEFTFPEPKDKDTKITPPGKNFVIWNIGKDTAGSSSSGGRYTDAFSKTFDIYTDFLNGSNIINDVKVFVIAAKDLTDNVSTEVWRVGAFNALPTFKIEAPKADGTSGTEVKTQTMVTAIPDKEYPVTITPISDLEITTFKVNNATVTGTSYTYKITGNDTKSGTKTVISYSAEDKLGNKNSGTFTVQFDEIPKISSIICNQGVDLTSSQAGDTIRMNGTLTLQVVFDRGVTITGTPKLTLNCYKNANDTAVAGTMELSCTTTGNSSSLTFEKKIEDEVEYKKIVVKKDSDGNLINLGSAKIARSEINADLTGTPTGASGFKLIIDSKPPTLDSYAGMRTGSTANYTKTSGAVNIKMNFSEPVTAQNGNITIYRKGSQDVTSGNHTWRIPAVISADVFEKIWNNSSAENRIVLSSSSKATSVNGNDAYGVKSLVSAGPYKMYTNGLVLNKNPIYQYVNSGGNAVKSSTVIHAANSVMVPDLTTKYVLDWQFDTAATSDSKKTISLADGTTNSVSVNEIRTALEAANYHKTTIPLSRLTFNTARTQATLTIKDSDFIDEIHEGVEFIMEIPEKAFADDVQNLSGEIEKYTFTVGKTAKPVIRVNRWSTNLTDNEVKNADANHCGRIAPDGENQGKARVKIDCETPEATIKYQVTTLTINSDYNTTTSNFQKNLTPPDYKPANVGATASTNDSVDPKFNNAGMLTAAAPSFGKANYKKEIEATKDYSASFSVGDGSTDTGQRIYIAAQATSSNSDLQDSENAFEGAFKTVMYYRNMLSGTTGYNRWNFKVHACQSPEGVSSTAGWPITMRLHTHETTTTEGTRDCYKVAVRDKDGWLYRWMSWELLSDDFFTVTTVTWNFQININSLASYGSFIWGYNVATWPMTQN